MAASLQNWTRTVRCAQNKEEIILTGEALLFLNQPADWTNLQYEEIKLMTKCREYDNRRLVVIKTRNPCKTYQHRDKYVLQQQIFCLPLSCTSDRFFFQLLLQFEIKYAFTFFLKCISKLGRCQRLVGSDSSGSCWPRYRSMSNAVRWRCTALSHLPSLLIWQYDNNKNAER